MQDFITWISFLLKFVYDALYTIKVPGLGISFLMLFIISAIMSVFITLIVQIVFQVAGKSNRHKKSNARSNTQKKGGDG